ncbi:hypothetical protein V8G54_005848, partial [Vigna mungo]
GHGFSWASPSSHPKSNQLFLFSFNIKPLWFKACRFIPNLRISMHRPPIDDNCSVPRHIESFHTYILGSNVWYEHWSWRIQPKCLKNYFPKITKFWKVCLIQQPIFSHHSLQLLSRLLHHFCLIQQIRQRPLQSSRRRVCSSK